jgi:hypothetical protein
MEKKTLLELIGACSLLAVLVALLVYFFRKSDYTVSH